MKKSETILEERIRRIIYLIRGQKVILDRDLASLYEVPTKALKQAIRRNAGRFPPDFMIVVARKELTILRSQSVTSSSWGDARYLPMAFTEQGIFQYIEGTHLYTVFETDLRLQYILRGHRISVATIDLAQEWREIHRRLLSLVSEPEAVFAQA